MEDIREEKLASNTISGGQYARIKKLYEQFVQAYRRAEIKKYITYNPMYEVIKPKSNKQTKVVGASVIPKKENTTYIKRNEYRVAERGASWKFKLINAVDKSLKNSCSKEEFIKNMNNLGYQVNWTDTRKYITYTTPEGYKCRDNKLYDEKYSKGEMENEFRRIKEKQSSSTGESSNTISSKDELLSNRANNTARFVRVEYENKRRYCRNEKEIDGYTGKNIKGQYSNERTVESIVGRENQRTILLSEERFKGNGRKSEKENFQSKVENGISNILGGIIAISNMVSNSQVDNRPKRSIRRYRTLSKQAMKEYVKKKANSSSFDWEEEI